MPQLKVTAFDGVYPRTSPTLLKDNQATQADNVKLYSGELRYWRGPSRINTSIVNGAQSIYKLIKGTDSKWLSWATDVDVAPGPLADISEIRVYYTGDGNPKKTNWALAGASDYQDLGVPAPASALTVTSSGSSSSTYSEDRVYIYTYVNTFGSIQEEGPPSPPSAVTNIVTGNSAILTGFSGIPAGHLNITSIRIYRSVSGATTGSNYAFVAEIPVGSSTYTDGVLTTNLGEAIPSLTWLSPPSNLTGMVSLANGSLAGFFGNTVAISEPYHPHAWPIAYQYNFPYKIVGLGVYGSSIVVCTEYFPYILTGIDPAAMSKEKVPLPEPCVSKRSIVADEHGVLYASPNGVVGIGPSERGVMTTPLFRREEWQIYAPNTITAGIYDQKYFSFFQSPTKGNKCAVLNRGDVPALSFLSTYATAVHVDTKNGLMYYVDGVDNHLYQLDADELQPYVYEWTSKRFVFPNGVAFSAIKVDADYTQINDSTTYQQVYAQIAAQNQAIFAGNLQGALNASAVNTYTIDGSILTELPEQANIRHVQVLIYGDGQLICSLPFLTLDPLRLPPFKCRELQFKLVGDCSVRSIALATTVPELHQ